MKNKRIFVIGIISLMLVGAIVFIKNSTGASIANLATSVTLNSPAQNGALYSNLSENFLSTDVADPTIIKGNDGCFYVFATNHAAYKSCDSKNWNTWDYNINASLPNYDYFWAPEIHKINNYYYMFFTLVKWGSGYPWASDSFGSVYYARSTDLVNFEYLGEVPYGSNYFNGRVDNKNHIDGSLLIDNGKYYFYYKLENRDNILDYQNQQIYGIELRLNSNGKFTEVGNPTVVMRRNTESNPLTSNEFTWHCWQDGNYAADTENINEGPYVIKKDNKYYLTYSIGEFTNDSYHVVAATSDSPLGPYVRDKMTTKNSLNENQFNIRDFVSGANYPSTAATDYSRNSFKNIYGTGHGSILTISNHDSLVGFYNDYYYVYHSNKYSNGTYEGRKLTIDGVNFKNGVMFLNGPTTDIQPLISGSTLDGVSYYKIPTKKYSINNSALSDGLKYSAKNMSFSTYSTSSLNIQFTNNERVSLSDIWLYSDSSNFSGISGTLYINEGTNKDYRMPFTAQVSGRTAKIQLPNIAEKVKNVRVVFNKTLKLSEVELIRNSQDNYYQVNFDSNGGNNISSVLTVYAGSANNKVSVPTRKNYAFLGWYTSKTGGTLVYGANGSCNKSASSYWNSKGNWNYKNDITLYAHWQELTQPLPPMPSPTSSTTPTTKPTTKPTTNPTTKPTTNPTTNPTTKPTTKPTSTPTIKPAPTESLLPTNIPLPTQSTSPIPTPTSSITPTNNPTPTPSDASEDVVLEPKKVGLFEYLFTNPVGIVAVVLVSAFLGYGGYSVYKYIKENK